MPFCRLLAGFPAVALSASRQLPGELRLAVLMSWLVIG
jgi:hypothetical protein